MGKFQLGKLIYTKHNMVGMNVFCKQYQYGKKKPIQLLNLERPILSSLLTLKSVRKRRQAKQRSRARKIYSNREENKECDLLAKEMISYDSKYLFQCFQITTTIYQQLSR